MLKRQNIKLNLLYSNPTQLYQILDKNLYQVTTSLVQASLQYLHGALGTSSSSSSYVTVYLPP